MADDPTHDQPVDDEEVSVFEQHPAEPDHVVVNGRQLRDITYDLLAAIVDANRPPSVFVRGGTLTRVRQDERDRPIVEAMSVDVLRHRIARVTNTFRVTQDGKHTAVPPPIDAVKDLTALGSWPLPPLEAVTEIPTLRPDGTINHAAGYDDATRLLHVPAPGLQVPPVLDQPTVDDIDHALALIEETLEDFPFDTTSDRANAIGALLTPIVRPAVPGQVPLCLIDAPEPGTGKGLFVNVVAVIATGRPAPMRPLAGHDDEIRKMITSTLAEGPTIVALDNIEEAIRSPSLAAVLTSDEWADRLLGRSETIKLPNRATWMATGNNLQVGGDLGRRCYRVRLDARQARPYTRTDFRHPDLLHWCTERRGDLIAALLTLARSWYAAGQPHADVPAIGGFTSWARIVGGILTHAGVDGFLQNLQQFHAEADRDADEWEMFLLAWRDQFGVRAVTAADVAQAIQVPAPSPIRQALPSELAAAVSRDSFAKSLGHALRSKSGRHFGESGLHIQDRGKNRGKVQTWTVYANDDEVAVAQVLPMAVGQQNSNGDPSNIPAHPRNPRDNRGDEGNRGDLFSQRVQEPEIHVEPGEEYPANPRNPRGDHEEPKQPPWPDEPAWLDQPEGDAT